MSNEVKANIRRTDTWIRGLFILLFAVIYSIAEVVMGAIVLFQFGSLLFTGKTNEKLYRFSHGLTAYFYQLVQFFTYRSDLKPYPFSEWPDEGLESVQQQESEMQQAAQQKQEEKPPGEPSGATKPAEPTGPDEDVQETKE